MKDCIKCIFSERRDSGWFCVPDLKEFRTPIDTTKAANSCELYTTDEEIAEAWPIEGKGGK